MDEDASGASVPRLSSPSRTELLPRRAAGNRRQQIEPLHGRLIKRAIVRLIDDADGGDGRVPPESSPAHSRSSALPPSGRYCFGAAAPSRVPRPAATTSAMQSFIAAS